MELRNYLPCLLAWMIRIGASSLDNKTCVSRTRSSSLTLDNGRIVSWRGRIFVVFHHNLQTSHDHDHSFARHPFFEAFVANIVILHPPPLAIPPLKPPPPTLIRLTILSRRRMPYQCRHALHPPSNISETTRCIWSVVGASSEFLTWVWVVR